MKKNWGRKFLNFIVLICFSLCTQAPSQAKPAIVLKTTPYFGSPLSEELPLGFINKMDTCLTVGSMVDSLGAPWFRALLGGRTYWIRGADVKYAADMPPDFQSQQTRGDDDKKRRLRILENKPDWPHRVKMAVRDGQICLDMTEEQLAAAWGDPFQKSTAYMLGIGGYDVWLYKSFSDKILFVTIQNGRIIGWSEDK